MATAPDAAPRYAIGPLCLSVSVGDFEAWLARAEAGAEIVYARGPMLDQKRDVVALVRAYADAGEVRTHQRKSAGSWEYFAVRRDVARERAAGVRSGRAGRPAAPRVQAIEPEAETPQGRMLAILRRCISLGVPARTNAELAREMGLKDAEAARYIFNQLVAASVITVRSFGVRERRVVTMVATGKSTVRGAL